MLYPHGMDCPFQKYSNFGWTSGVMLKPGLGRQRDLPEFVCGGEQEGECKRIVCVSECERLCVRARM